MTEKQFDLGRYVRWRPRTDGTHAVSFSVPDNIRPMDWPQTISLPEIGPDRGSLNEGWFRRAVKSDAERLNAQLDEELRLAGLLEGRDRRTIAELVTVYLNDERYRSLSAEARYRNLRASNIILEWSASRGHPDFDTVSRAHISAMLRHFDDRQFERLSVRSFWNILGELAFLIWKIPNPSKGMSWTPPVPAAVHLWDAAVVEKYAEGAVEIGQPGLAAFLRVQFFIGQRMGDALATRHDIEYVKGALGVKQGKGGELVYIPLPRELRDQIDAARIAESPYLFNDAFTGTRFGSMHAVMTELRAHILSAGDPLHELRVLRHSAVCEMSRLGLTETKIASRTGHLLGQITTILDRYMLDRQGVARAAAIEQHIAAGGDASDFIQDAAPAMQDYHGDRKKLKFYAGPGVRKTLTRRRRRAPGRPAQWADGGLTDDQVNDWAVAMGLQAA